MKIRNIVSAAAACAVAAAALVIPTSAEESYVAGITWQSSSYYFRNTIAQSELLYWDNDLGEAAPLEGATFTDANITGDGEYTVTLDGVNDGGWNMLKLESNIDLDATPDVKFEITSVELNGAAVDFDKDAAVMSVDAATKSDDYSDWDFDIKNTARIQLINVYDTSQLSRTTPTSPSRLHSPLPVLAAAKLRLMTTPQQQRIQLLLKPALTRVLLTPALRA